MSVQNRLRLARWLLGNRITNTGTIHPPAPVDDLDTTVTAGGLKEDTDGSRLEASSRPSPLRSSNDGHPPRVRIKPLIQTSNSNNNNKNDCDDTQPVPSSRPSTIPATTLAQKAATTSLSSAPTSTTTPFYQPAYPSRSHVQSYPHQRPHHPSIVLLLHPRVVPRITPVPKHGQRHGNSHLLSFGRTPKRHNRHENRYS